MLCSVPSFEVLKLSHWSSILYHSLFGRKVQLLKMFKVRYDVVFKVRYNVVFKVRYNVFKVR